jgi:hypothetical protein
MTKKTTPHPSAESRRKHDRVYVLLDRKARDKLKIIASARRMQFVDLLGAMAEREIKAWEKLSGSSLDDLLAADRMLAGSSKNSDDD